MHAACALPSELSALCVAFFQRFCYQQLAASCFLFALFFTLLSFIFNHLQPLCPKQGIEGTPPKQWDSRFCLPAAGGAVLRRSINDLSTTIDWRTDASKPSVQA